MTKPVSNREIARVNATLDKHLLSRVDTYAARHHEDRSTAIRQLLDHALRDLAKDEAIEAYVGGRLTLRELAAALDLDTWRAHDLLASEGVAVAQGDIAETAADLDAAIADLPTSSARSTPSPRARKRSP